MKVKEVMDEIEVMRIHLDDVVALSTLSVIAGNEKLSTAIENVIRLLNNEIERLDSIVDNTEVEV